MTAILSYLRFSDVRQRTSRHSVGWYILATIAALLAMLSKPSAVVVPLLAAILDGGLLGRKWTRVAIALSPWLVGGLFVTVLTSHLQAPRTSDLGIALWARPLIALDALAFYLGKLLLPITTVAYQQDTTGPGGISLLVNLCAEYSRSPANVMREGRYWYLVGLFPIGALAILASLPQRRIWLTAAALFIAALAPTLGLVAFAYQQYSTVADRYAYLAMLGPALAMAWWLAHPPRLAKSVACGLVVGALGITSYLHVATWNNDLSLFSHNIAVNSRSALAHSKLGNISFRGQQWESAIRYYRRAFELEPLDWRWEFNLALALAADAQYEEAITRFQHVIANQPRLAEAHARVGVCYLNQLKLDEAEREFNQAVALDPKCGAAQMGLTTIRIRRDHAAREGR